MRVAIKVVSSVALWLVLIGQSAFAQTPPGFVYAMVNNNNPAENMIYGFSLDPTTGALTPLPGFPVATGGTGASGLTTSEALVYDPAQSRLYATNVNNRVSMFDVNRATGAITALPFSPFFIQGALHGCMAVSPDGSILVGADLLSPFVDSLQIGTSSVTPAPGSPYNTGSPSFSCAFRRDGGAVYTGGNILFISGWTVAPSTGALTPMPGSPFATPVTATGYVTDTLNRLFTVSFTDGAVRAYSIEAGAPALLGSPTPSGQTGQIQGALHPSGYYLATARNSNNVAVFRITGLGAETTLTPAPGSPFDTGGTFSNASVVDSSGRVIVTANGSSRNLSTFRFNLSTGALTRVGLQPVDALGTTGGIVGLAFTALNGTPFISDTGNQSVDEDSATAALTFQIFDSDTAAESLTVSATSSDETIVPNGNIAIGGTGADRTITVTPALNANGGPVTITVTVSDGTATASDTFTVQVSPVADPPTITDITNQTTDEDTATGALPFTVGDGDGIGTVTVSATSNDQTLVPNANIAIGGTGANRTITVTPALNANGGPVTITVTVTDGTFSATDTFTVLVNAVNDAPTITDVANQTIDEDAATAALPFTIGDLETAAASLTLSAISSHPAIVPNGNIVLGGSGANRTVTVTPAANANGGPVTITVTVSDGVLSASDLFTLTVNAVNDAPTITPIANQTILASSSTPPLSFTVGDIETAAASLTVSAVSSNPALVTPAGFGFAGAGVNRTLTVTPNGNATGTALITVSVRDGTVATSTAFQFTVNPLPSGPGEPGVPAGNQPPTITGLSNATIDENGTLTVTLTIGDDGTPVGGLSLNATSSNASVVPSAGLVLGGAGATRTLTITPLPDTAGQTTISVTVGDGALTTTATAIITVQALAPGAVPQPPTGFTATASGSDVRLSWIEPASGPRPSFFVLEGGTAPGASTLPVVNTITRRTTWTVSLPPGTYFFRARSGNRRGTSVVSNEAGVIVTTLLNVPGAPIGLSVSVDGTRTTFGWQRPVTGGEAIAWIVELDNSPGPADLRTFRLPATILGGSIDLPRGEYVARVRGENSAGQGPASNEPRFTVDLPSGGGCDAPDAPVLLPPAIVGHTVTLTWRSPRTGVPVSYRLLIGSAPGGSDLRVVNVGPVNAFVLTAPPGTYHATIVASNTCGPGAASNSVPVIVTGLGPPPPPANVRFQVVGRTVTLAWDPSPGAASYLIEVGTAPGASNALLYPLVGTFVAPDAPSGTWYVRVRAVGAGGASTPSMEIVIVIP